MRGNTGEKTVLCDHCGKSDTATLEETGDEDTDNIEIVNLDPEQEEILPNVTCEMNFEVKFPCDKFDKECITFDILEYHKKSLHFVQIFLWYLCWSHHTKSPRGESTPQDQN